MNSDAEMGRFSCIAAAVALSALMLFCDEFAARFLGMLLLIVVWREIKHPRSLNRATRSGNDDDQK